jgi:acetyltransferase-like isoleucine patch superfamily enzyme
MKADDHSTNDNYRLEYEAFNRMVRGKPLSPWQFTVLVFKSIFMLFEGLIRYIPGGFGFKLRYYFYKPLLKHLGRDVMIDVGVHLSGPANISIGDFTWIDTYCRIEAYLGEVRIGNRVHMASFSIIGARAPVIVEDFVGIGAGTKIYSNTEAPIDGKRMSGPMVPEEYKAFISAPVTLHKDSFVGANCVLLPGAELGEGCVVGANCVVSSKLLPNTVYSVAPPRPYLARVPVQVPDEY